MKKMRFYPTIWQTIPFSFELVDQWNAEGKKVADLTLKNEDANKKGVSEMILNVTRLSTLDGRGKEYLIKDFQQKTCLNLKGIHTGLFIRLKNVLELGAGEYTAFRFYLNSSGNSFGYSDRSIKPIYGLEYLDFEIGNGLKINDGEAPQVILRFDFERYAVSSYFEPILRFFKRSKALTAKLAHGFEN